MKKCPRCNKVSDNDIRFCPSCGTEVFFVERFKKTDRKILTLYFSATGNTKFIAELFSRKMNAKCLSIEENANFTDEIKAHDTIAFCYPIYGSRLPRIMREFAAKNMDNLGEKNVIILITQMMFSGDGARVFTDMFREGTIKIIYAEHFNMPNNVCNIPLLRKPGQKKIKRYLRKAEAKMAKVCHNIETGITVKRGFSGFAQLLGKIQGIPWQGDSREDLINRYKTGFQSDANELYKSKFSVEQRAIDGIKIDKDCTACNLCVSICPMKNLEEIKGEIRQKNNCIICYRCVNQCPAKAITVLIHRKPKWQYNGPCN